MESGETTERGRRASARQEAGARGVAGEQRARTACGEPRKKQARAAGTVLLVGVPNCGKSALFCRLTGGHARVGNWAGVTVEKTAGKLRGTSYTLVDTPGICGLSPTREEERVTTDAIRGGDYLLVVQVVDGEAPARSFRLTLELLAAGVPLVLAVNRCDLLRARGCVPDCAAVARESGVPVFAVSGRSGEGVETLGDAIVKMLSEDGETPEKFGSARYSRASDPTVAERWARMLVGGRAARRNAKVDRLLMGSRWGYLVAAATLAALLAGTSGAFSLIGGLGDALGAWVVGKAAAWLTAWGAGAFLTGFLSQGLLGSFFTALTFLLPLFCFYAMTAALEDSGYLARMTFLWDRACARVGLGGGVVMPLLLSFGCGATGVSACRTLPRGERGGCAGFCTYFPCHAKLPLIACAVGYCGLGWWGTLILFLLPCLVGLAAVAISGRGGGEYIEESPPLSMPSHHGVVRSSLWRTREFIGRAGGLIALSGAVIWLLSHIGGDVRAAEMDESLLAALGRFLYPLFAPLGFSSWQAVAATLSGIVAKENTVVVLSLLGGAEVLGGLGGAVSFCLFNLLCPPCIAAIAQMRRVLGRRAWWYLLAELLIAAALAALARLLLGA